jgi:hypothetical protein
MAEFPGAVDGFVLLQMESDEPQNNKMYTGLQPVASLSFVIAVSCVN